jgi:hypothetical protein
MKVKEGKLGRGFCRYIKSQFMEVKMMPGRWCASPIIYNFDMQFTNQSHFTEITFHSLPTCLDFPII